MDWRKVYNKIISSKSTLKNLLGDKATSDGILIYDPPLSIEIKDDAVLFLLNNEISAILDKSGLSIFDEEVRKEVEYWCIALSSLGFKRYRIKQKR